MEEKEESGVSPEGVSSSSHHMVKVDLTGIRVRRAITGADFTLVADLRRTSAPRQAIRPVGEWLDALDYSLRTFCLIAYDDAGEPVATMRIQDGLASELEMARIIPLDAILTAAQMPVVQLDRFGMAGVTRGIDAMAALLKAIWVWCLECEVKNMLVAAPTWLKPLCESLTFEPVGKPETLPEIYTGGVWHTAMILPVRRLIDTWATERHPFAEQFLRTAHPELMFDRPGVLMPLRR